MTAPNRYRVKESFRYGGETYHPGDHFKGDEEEARLLTRFLHDVAAIAETGNLTVLSQANEQLVDRIRALEQELSDANTSLTNGKAFTEKLMSDLSDRDRALGEANTELNRVREENTTLTVRIAELEKTPAPPEEKKKGGKS